MPLTMVWCIPTTINASAMERMLASINFIALPQVKVFYYPALFEVYKLKNYRLLPFLFH